MSHFLLLVFQVRQVGVAGRNNVEAAASRGGAVREQEQEQEQDSKTKAVITLHRSAHLVVCRAQREWTKICRPYHKAANCSVSFTWNAAETTPPTRLVPGLSSATAVSAGYFKHLGLMSGCRGVWFPLHLRNALLHARFE